MDFYKKLYVSPRIRNVRQIKNDLVRGKGHLRIYVLLLAKGPEEKPQLEIMHCANLQSSWYRSFPPLIIGIAEGKADAIEMVSRITQEAFELTGQWDAAAYLASCLEGSK